MQNVLGDIRVGYLYNHASAFTTTDIEQVAQLWQRDRAKLATF